MPHFRDQLRAWAVASVIAAGLLAIAPARADAEALLLIEASTGKVLHAENAAYPWYPASVTKLMTAYVALRAVKAGRVSLDTLLTVSPAAAAQQPSKMGFAAGTELTLDNALKMIMVKSANDIAVVIAEGISGSVTNFAADMNWAAQRLGMTQTHYVNPHGLPDERQVTSARDLGILARGLLLEFPEYDSYWSIPAIKFGRRVMRNYNTLIGRYDGADGMKTGFICASGFNLVASATRNGRRLVAVVLGAPSSGVRAAKAAALLEQGFNTGLLAWLTPSLGAVDALVPINAAPPDLYEQTCGKHRVRPPAEDADDDETELADAAGVTLTNLWMPESKPSQLLQPYVAEPPVTVYAGPPKPAPTTRLASAGTIPITPVAAAVVASPPASRKAAAVPLPRPRP